MIVVSDTTALNYLLLINAVDVLPSLFLQVYVPLEVLRELRDVRAPQAVREWICAPPGWLHVRNASFRLASTARLDLGEAEAISLAKEMNITGLLIDERRGSRVALNEGLSPIPTLAILERAAERKLLDLPSVIRKLRETSFRIAPEHLEAALRRDMIRNRSH